MPGRERERLYNRARKNASFSQLSQNVRCKKFRHALCDQTFHKIKGEIVLCDLSIRFIWSVRRFFGDKKELSECIPSDKQPDLRMMVLVGNGTLCIVDGVDAAVRSGGNMLIFFMHLNLIAWYKLVKRALAELIVRYDLSYADLAVYIEKINQELNQQLQVLRAIDYDAYEKELEQINTISGLLDDKQNCTDKIYQKLNEMGVNMQFHSSEEFDEKMMDDEFVLEL